MKKPNTIKTYVHIELTEIKQNWNIVCFFFLSYQASLFRNCTTYFHRLDTEVLVIQTMFLIQFSVFFSLINFIFLFNILISSSHYSWNFHQNIIDCYIFWKHCPPTFDVANQNNNITETFWCLLTPSAIRICS